MAISSRKTAWLIVTVLAVVAVQLAIIGFIGANILSNSFHQRRAFQPGPQQAQREGFATPVGRPIRPTTGQPTAARRPKPAGPRAEPPQFSVAGGIYTNTVTVKLQAKATQAAIRYTLDGTEPTERSAVYASALTIKETTRIRATCFQPGVAPSLTVSHSYTIAAGDLANFNSNLPIVVIDMFDQRAGTVNYVPMAVRFINTSRERASIFGPADYDGEAEIKRRGYSSLRLPKSSFTLKLRDGDGDKVKAPLFGMPSESDWVLYAPYSDKTMMRDVLGYELGNAMGHYAPRTRFVEVFVHYYNGTLSASRDYAGVYVLVEKIKRGKERVNIAKLGPEHNAEPDISGGYILKRDHGAMNAGGGGRNRGGFGGPPRSNNDGVGFITPQGLHLFHVEPEETELTAQQKKWITGYLAEFERALHGPNFADPQKGYAKYLDVEAFVDFFWLVEFSKNIDALRYSAFLTKPRGGKLVMGPAWDWNLSFGNADYYEADEPSGWYYQNLRDTEISWIYRLKDDPNFIQRLTDRWAELRTNVLAQDRVLARVDAIRAQLREAQPRDNNKWRVIGRNVQPNSYVGPTYEAEVNWMKTWIKNRSAWIDRQYLRAPQFSENSGPVKPGTKLTLSGERGEIYFTTDGSDPRASGGGKSAAAQPFSQPLTVDKKLSVTARLRRGQLWSAPAKVVLKLDSTPAGQ